MSILNNKTPLANSTEKKQKKNTNQVFLVSFTHLGEISLPLHNEQQNRSTTHLKHFWPSLMKV